MKIKFIQTRSNRQKQKSNEKGQAFLMVLILLLVGTLIITSSLAFIAASIKTNGPYIKNTNDLYAAEAGVQDGEYNMLNQTVAGLNTLFTPTNYSEYDYTDKWTYPLSKQVNSDSVNVKVQNVWVPMIDDNTPGWYPTVSNLLPPDGVITPPSPAEASNIINNTNLVVTGGVTSAASKIYKVNITYLGGSVSLPIISIGVWLPQGYTYNVGSSNLQGIYSTEQLIRDAGNEAVIWSFPSTTTFSSLQTSLGQSGTGIVSLGITFTYATTLSSLPDALGWINDGNNTGNSVFPYDYTWDSDIQDYNITSTAGKTTIQTYVPTSSIRDLGSAINGDYVTAGASLMVMGETQTQDPHGIRYNLESSGSSTVNNIPAGSRIEGAYLYWSGWLASRNDALGNSYGTKVDLWINNNQVCFNGSGAYTRGSTAITSTKNQTQVINTTGNGDFSYSCYCDVTALVQGELKAETGNPSNPGNATYTVGPASGCTLGSTGNEWSYAGWSLILIYSGPTTLGHQLYLYDTFIHAAGNGGNTSENGSDIDPTGATSGPGGVVSGFIVPQEIPGEVNAAEFTAFVGEGDWCYAGDFLAFNAPSQYWSNPWSIPDPTTSKPWKLWDGITLSSSIVADPPYDPNTAASPDNVWNSYPQPGSNVGNADGVDIKTFDITWASGLLQPGETSARIDMPTQVDEFNLVYMIFSFRSSVTSGGAISYLITHN